MATVVQVIMQVKVNASLQVKNRELNHASKSNEKKWINNGKKTVRCLLVQHTPFSRICINVFGLPRSIKPIFK